MHSQHFKQQASATRPHSRILTVACASCAMLLQACGATLQASQSASLELPSPPSLSTPQPAQPYSKSWQTEVDARRLHRALPCVHLGQPYSKSWQTEVDAWQSAVQTSRERLMATPLTPR